MGLSDRERILMYIVDQLSATLLLAPACRGYRKEDFTSPSLGEMCHFAHYDKPQPGDLVLAKTGGIGEFKIGWFVESRQGNFGGAVIREIGSDLLCNYDNESFVPIRGLHKSMLYEGEQRAMYQKVLRAFRKGDEYLYRFGGLDFYGEEIAITVREVFGGLGGNSDPFDVRMKWNKRTSVKRILQTMREQGYGTRSFSVVLPPALASQDGKK